MSARIPFEISIEFLGLSQSFTSMVFDRHAVSDKVPND